MNKAPNTLREACDIFEIERAKSKFGFEKDRIKLQEREGKENKNPNNNQMTTSCIKTEPVKITPSNNNNNNNNNVSGQRYTPSIVNDKQYSSGTFSTPQIVTPFVKSVSNNGGCSPATGLARFQQNSAQNDRNRNFTNTSPHLNPNVMENVPSTLQGTCFNENTNLKRTFPGNANRNTGPLKKNQSSVPINPYATKKKASL